MVKYNGEIITPTLSTLYNKYDVTDADVELYKLLIENGEVEEAVELFIKKYITAPTEDYTNAIILYLSFSDQGEITKDMNKMERSISLMSFGLSGLLIKNFNDFMKKSYSDNVFAQNNISKAKVQNIINKSTLSNFEALTDKTMTSTQADVLKNIRTMQKEYVLFNQRNLGKKVLDTEVTAFKAMLKKKYPEYYKMKQGKLMSTKMFGTPPKSKHYNLNYYIDMSVRTTLLNVDRTAVQTGVLLKEQKKTLNKNRVAVNLIEYALIDNRTLKTGKQREICQKILGDKRYGVPLLALDQKTADLLGIMTVDEAMSTPDYAMGVWCRHGGKPLSTTMRKKMENILKIKLREVA